MTIASLLLVGAVALTSENLWAASGRAKCTVVIPAPVEWFAAPPAARGRKENIACR